MEVSFGNFTDEQENVIFKTLANYFCAVHSKVSAFFSKLDSLFDFYSYNYFTGHVTFCLVF